MAEYVNKALEELLPGLEYFSSAKIFSPREIRTIVKRRKYFEYKIKRRIPDKKDYLRYVEYEMNLAQLRGIREEEKMVSNFDRAQADVAAFKHIKKIFLRALHRFGSDKDLWHSYLDFARSAGFRKALSFAFSRALQLHPKEPSFWLKASDWEFEDNSNIIAARSLLQRAIRFLPDHPVLRIKFFQLEILYLKGVQESIQAAPDALGAIQLPTGEFDETPFMKGAIPLVILKNSLSTVNTVEFCFSMLDTYHECHHSQPELELEILTHLLAHFDKDPTVWAGLAQRAPHILKTSLSTALSALDYQLPKSKITHCKPADIWQIGVAHIGTGEVWWLRAQMFPDQTEAFGLEMRKLKVVPSKEFYQQWLEILRANGKDYAAVLKEADSRYPNSLAFVQWSLESRSLTLAEAKSIITEHSTASAEFLRALQQVVLEKVPAVADFSALLKEFALRSEKSYSLKEWAVRHVAGWPESDRRAIYKLVLGLPGTPASLYVYISANERQSDPQYARLLLQQALVQHPRDQALWEEAISFEYEQNDIPAANLLFQRGRTALPNPDDFVAQHSLRWLKKQAL